MSARVAMLWIAVGVAVLCITGQPMLPALAAEPTHAAKSDKLSVMPAKGDLLTRTPDNAKPDRAKPVPSGPRRQAAMIEPAFASRGTVAGKLIDVAVRDDGLWLNSFATRSMPLEALDCAVLSDEIVDRLALPADAVERLAQEELMRQTRVCAVNGSLLLTCYGGAATVSLRPPQAADGCGG